MTNRELENKYCRLSVSDFRSLILKHDQESDLAAYYLLHKKLEGSLKYIFNRYELGIEYGDAISDFFLYLRQGRSGKDEESYKSLTGIRSWLSFDSWVCSVFENFLRDKFKEIEAEKKACEEEDLVYRDEDTYFRELKIKRLAFLIGNINAFYAPLDKFIFYRSMLAKLDKSQMIPNQRMAPALGMSYDNYRQMESRIKNRAKTSIETKEKLASKKFSRADKDLILEIYTEFDDLGCILYKLYEKTLVSLDNYKEVKALRLQVWEEDREESKRKQLEPSNCGTRYSIDDDYDKEPLFGEKCSHSHNENEVPKIKFSLTKQHIHRTPLDPPDGFIRLSEIYDEMAANRPVEFDFADYITKAKQYKAFLWLLE